MLESLTACDRHGVRLVRGCTICGNAGLELIAPLDRCPTCSLDLPASRPIPALPGEVAWIRYLLGRIGVLSSRPTRPLDEVPCFDAPSVVAITGQAALAVRTGPFEVAFDEGLVTDAGVRTLEDWPASFVDVLDCIADVSPGSRRVDEAYGTLYARITAPSSLVPDSVVQAFHTHAAARGFLWSGERSGRDLGGADDPLSRADVARLRATLPGRGRAPEKVSRREARLLLSGSAILTLDAAGQILGTGYDVLRSLRDAGVLPPARPPTRGIRDVFYSSEAEALLSRLVDGVPDLTACPAGSVAVRDFAGVRVARVLEATLARRLRPIGLLPGGPALDCLVFHKADVAPFCGQERVAKGWRVARDRSDAGSSLNSVKA